MCFSVAEPGAGFDSRGIGLKVQKKLLGKMSSKKIAKAFIDDRTGAVLDKIYKINKDYCNNKKTAEKVMKDMIKIVVKIGILYRNDQLNKEELILAERFKKKFQSISMTIISFFEVDFTFDKNFLSRNLQEVSSMLKQLVARHLTDKSIARIDNVFDFFSDTDYLAVLFEPDGPYSHILSSIVDDMHHMMEEGTI